MGKRKYRTTFGDLAVYVFLVLIVALALFTLFRKRSADKDSRFVVKNNGKYGFIDREGKLTIPAQFEFASDFCEGLAAVMYDWKWVYIDETGKVVLRPNTPEGIIIETDFLTGRRDILTPVTEFHDGMAAIWQDGKWQYIDRKGHVMAPEIDIRPEVRVPQHKSDGSKIPLVLCYSAPSAHVFSEGLAAIRINGKYGLINKSGKIVIPPRYEQVDPFSEGFAPVLMDGKWGTINKKGEILIPPQFSDVRPFNNGLWPVSVNGGSWGFVDAKGEWVIKPRFRGAHSFSDGLASVEDVTGWYFIDRSGQRVIPQNFQWVYGFGDEGLAAVEVDDKYGFIDKSGSFVIQPQYGSANNFRDGLASISNGVQKGYINRKGEVVWLQPFR